MAVTWHCDICDAPGTIHPKTEPMMRKKTVTYEVPDPKDPKKKIRQKASRDVPVTTTIRRQNTQTARVETVEIARTKDLQPRAIMVVLQVGMENVQKDFCVKCYDKKIKPHVEKLFDLLHKLQDKA